MTGSSSVLVAALALAMLLPTGAQAASVVYQGSDGNVWLATPDGARQHKVTTDGTPGDPYRSPSRADDGRIVTSRSDHNFHVLNANGTRASGPWSASNLFSSSPLSAQVAPDGSLIAYWYMHVPFPNPMNLDPFPRVTFAYPDRDSTSASFPVFDDWYLKPRWIPGTSGGIGMVQKYGDGVWWATTGGGGDPALEPPWIPAPPGKDIVSFDVSRTGGRVLVEYTPDGAGEGAPTELALRQMSGAPPAGTSELCTLPSFAGGLANPRWSPNAKQIAWHDGSGVKVSPAPSPSGGTCAIAPRLVAAGGTSPDWSAADLPSGGGGAGDLVRALKVKAVQKLRKALSSGLKLSVTCSRACTIQAQALLSRAAARKLKLAAAAKPVVVGRGSKRLSAPGTARVSVRFTRKAKKRLRRARKVRLTVRIKARDAAGALAVVRRRVTLRR